MPGSHPTRLIAFLVFGALTALGCVGTTDTGQQGETGSLSVDLVLADGIEIDEVGWQITGNGMDMSGDIDVSAPGSTASVEVFGLPPGEEDYTVTLTATSNDEQVTCQGSAPFNVEVGQSTNVMVMLNCKKPRTLGGVRVNGKFNICTQLTKTVVSPLRTSVGNDISLAAQAFDEEGDEIHYIWTGDGGSIADPSAASTTYTCQEVGDHTVTIMVTDNDVYCRMATWTIPVTCVEGDGGDLCEDVECPPDGNQCTDAACEPSSGECVSSNVDDGTLCEIIGVGDGICSNGQCVEIDLCEDVECNDDNECTNDACDPVDGECDFTDVDNGTSCSEDAGTCIDGACVVIIDKCEAVICDETGSACTVEMCNQDTGICDEMNVPDGTECNGGNGACSAGVCVDNNLCEGVDCSSANDCVQDGTCDPADGECIAGANEPADTDCSDGGTVCDGAGNCVECNSDGQCPDDGSDCTAAACDTNMCGQANVMNGMACDLPGMDDGMCENGTCVAAPDCIENTDCEDGDECTVNTCVDAMCVSQPEEDGATCDADGTPGACQGGVCVADECQVDADCPEDDGNECTVPVCDTSATPNTCGEDASAADGNACNAGGGACSGGTCVPVLPGPQTATVPNACGQNVSTALVPFPIALTVTPTNAPADGQPFNSNVTPIVDLDDAFLQGAANTLWTMFASTLTVAAVQTAQVEVSGFSGCSASPVLIVDGQAKTCLGGSNVGSPCTLDTECPGFGGGLCGYAVNIPNAPADCTTLQDCCDVDPCCPGSVIEAVGAACVGVNPQATCTANECVGGGPTNITDPVVLDTFPTVPFSCTADVANSPAAICSSGNRLPVVSGATPITETFFRVNAAGLPVRFDCEPGTLSQPIPCTADTDCNGNPGASPPEAPACQDGECNDNPTFIAFTGAVGPNGLICDAASDNAGEACTVDTDCVNVCDTTAGECEGDDTIACTADADCAGIGQCEPTCPRFTVLP